MKLLSIIFRENIALAICQTWAIYFLLPWHRQGFLRWFYFWLFFSFVVIAATVYWKSTRTFHNDISHLCNEISWEYGVWYKYCD